jgi:hypothetical protein
MLFGETVAVYCGTHRYSSYLTGNTLRLHYKAQPVNAVWENSRCLLWEPCGTHRYSPYLTGNTLRLRYRDQPVKLFGETVDVYCDYHTEHTDTVRTSQETHYVSATETNQLSYLGKQSLFIVRTIRNTQIQSVPHRKHITSPLQSPTS